MDGTSTALVLRSAPEEETTQGTEQEGTPSPFEQFLAELQRRNAATTSTMIGMAVWSGIPVEQVIADGLWVVMMKVAEKLHLPMTTEVQVTQGIAPRVNRLVNSGLLVVYGEDAAQAADAFETAVITPTLIKAKKLPANDPSPLQALWIDASAAFFAGLMREARHFREELIRLTAEGRRLNIAHEGRSVTYLSPNTFDASLYLRYLDLTDSYTPSVVGMKEQYADERNILDGMATKRARMQRDRESIQMLRKLPIRLEAVPVEMTLSSSRTVETEWIRTQLLLAAGGLKDSETIDALEFGPAVRLARRKKPATIIKAFLERMRARGYVAKDRDLELLMKRLTIEVGYVKNACLEVDAQTAAAYLVEVRTGYIHMRDEDALDVALGEGEDDLPRDEKGVPHVEMRDGAAARLKWSAVTLEQFQKMVESEVLTVDQLIGGILKMPIAQRKQAMDILMEPNVLKEPALALALKHDLVTFDDRFIDRYLKEIPAAYRSRAILEMLENIPHRKGTLTDGNLPLNVIRLVTWLRTQERAALLKLPSIRIPMQLLLIDCLLEADIRRRHQITARDFKSFCEAIGPDFWSRCVLGCEIIRRESVYAGVPDEILDSSTMLAQWTELATAPAGHTFASNLAECLFMKPQVVEALLKKLPEDEVFRWLFEGEPKLKQRLAKFQKDRENYYGKVVQPTKSLTKSTLKGKPPAKRGQARTR